MQVQDYAQHYAEIPNDELLRLALVPEQLTDEANMALQAELRNRGLASTEHVEAFRKQEDERKQQIDRDPGQLFLIHSYGIGRMRFGMADRKVNPETGLGEFTTTVFVVLFWLPLVPTGTFRVQSRRHFFVRRQFTVLERLPLSWSQIIRVWAAAAACIALLVILLKWLTF